MSEIATVANPQIQNDSLASFQVLASFANQLCKSEALPACYKNAANVLVALQTGKEMGLQPMESLNSLYIVNGKIQIWGSAQIKLLKLNGWKLNVRTTTDKLCDLQITKGDESFDYQTKFEELPTSSKAKAFAPKEKLYYHTVSRLIRFYVPEVLGGQHLYNEVEIADIEPTVTVTQLGDNESLIKFISTAKSIDVLKNIESQCKTDNEKLAYSEKLNTFLAVVEKPVTPEVETTPIEVETPVTIASLPVIDLFEQPKACHLKLYSVLGLAYPEPETYQRAIGLISEQYGMELIEDLTEAQCQEQINLIQKVIKN